MESQYSKMLRKTSFLNFFINTKNKCINKMSGLTNTTGFSFLGLTNLTQGNYDNLFVNNLTANTGTITVLNSTTGTITTIKTSQINGLTSTSSVNMGENGSSGSFIFYKQIDVLNNKSLTLQGGGVFANIFRAYITANPISLLDTSTGMINFGNLSGGGITIQDNTQFSANKSLTISNTGALFTNTLRSTFPANATFLLDTSTNIIYFGNLSGGGGINIQDNTTFSANKTLTMNGTGGIIYCNVYTGTATSSNLTLGVSGDTGNLQIFKTITSSNTYSGNNTYSGSNIFSGSTNTFNNTLLCNTFTGLTAAGNISLFSTTTGTLTLGNTGGGNFTINPNVVLATGKNLTLSATGKIVVDTIEGVGALDNISLFSTTTGTLTLGNTGGGNFTINPNVVLATGKNLTLSSTGKILCDVYTGTATSSNIEIGVSGDTALIRTRRDLYIGSTPLGSNKGIYCNYFNTLDVADTINFSATQTTGNINIQPSATSGNIVIGNTTPASDSGTLTINKNTILPANKTITLNTTGGKILNNVYTGTATNSTITIGEFGNTGNFVIYKTITSSNTYSGNNTYSGVNTFSGATNTFSNEILCSIYSGLTTSTNFQLGESGDSGRINCFRDLYIQTGKIVDSEVIQTNTLRAIADLVVGNALGAASNIFLVNSITANESLTIINGKNLLCNTYRGTTAASNISLFSTTTGSLTLGGVSSGISLADNTTLATGRTLTTSTTGSILCPTYNSTSATQSLSIGTTNTTANVSLATGLTTGTLSIGPNVATSNLAYPQGWSVFNSNVYIIAGRRLTMDASSSGIFSPSIGHGGSNFAICNQATDNVANITIGSTQSTGNITLGNTTPASDSGTLTINKNTTLGSGKTISCNDFQGTSASSQVRLVNTTTTGDIFIGGAITSGTIVISNLTTGTKPITLRNKVRIQTNIADAYFNVALGSANNIFQTTFLSASAMPPVYAAAPTDDWAVWESNTESEGSFIAQNGNTTIICNPGDNFAFHWQDEDTMGSASGFKFAVDGVMSTSSDRRLKRDINPIPVGSDLLDKLSLIQYVNYKKKAPSEDKYYKDGKLRQKYQDIRKGLIAQDVKQIFPEVVEKDGEYHMMKYAEVGIYFNMGVQELIKRDKEKQAQIDAQKLQIDDLTTRLARLEQILLNP